jgi:hypothetical protein
MMRKKKHLVRTPHSRRRLGLGLYGVVVGPVDQDGDIWIETKRPKGHPLPDYGFYLDWRDAPAIIRALIMVWWKAKRQSWNQSSQ